MRTTLTLDADRVDQLKALAARRKLSFEEVVNELLRRGLSPRGRGTAKPFRFVPFTFLAGVDPGRLNQLLDDLERWSNPLARGAVREERVDTARAAAC
jgi:hypothetical protein